MAAEDIRAQVQAWVEDEIGKQCFGEAFGWSLGWFPAPVPTPGGAVVIPAWQLLITCHNPVLGEGPLYHIAQLGYPRPKEDDVRREIADGLRQLRDLAASKLSGLNGRAKKALAK
jgi:hypothetical protein